MSVYVISFTSVLQFLEYRSFATLGIFIARYFIPFDDGKWDCTLNLSFWSFLVSVWKYNRFLYINSVSCSFTRLIDEFSSSCLVASLGFSKCSVMLSKNSYSFTFSFSIWIPFFPFWSCVITVARTSKPMLNKNGKDRCPCLVLDLKRYIFSTSILRKMFSVS